VTVNNGYEMRAWYDIKAFTPEGRADAAGLAESTRRVDAYLEAEMAHGVEASRIVLAGFSQGGAVALSGGLRFRERLADCSHSRPIFRIPRRSPPAGRWRTRACRS